MLRTRIIPVLLLNEGGLVKGEKFKNHKYVGDPINAVKIFNEKEVDELVFLDISNNAKKNGPDIKILSDIVSEAFMPFGYGGGVSEISHIEKLFSVGIEKIIINTAAYKDPNFIRKAVNISGSQSIVVSIDVKKSIMGNYNIYVDNGSFKTKLKLIEYVKKIEDLGAGEIIINSIDREGTGKGYDIELIKNISDLVKIPVVGSGGAGSLDDFLEAKKKTSVSALAAGDFFVFHGKHKAVLITYPNYSKLEELLGETF